MTTSATHTSFPFPLRADRIPRNRAPVTLADGDLYLPSMRTTPSNSFPVDLYIVMRAQPLDSRSEARSRSRSDVLRMNEAAPP